MNREDMIIHLKRIGKGAAIIIPFMSALILIIVLFGKFFPFMFFCTIMCCAFYMVGITLEETEADKSIIDFIKKQIERFKK